MQNSFKQVGNTPLIKLSILKPNEGASIWLKVESGNPTGSYKDRMAISVIGEALRHGNLALNQTVIEYTGGSTGSALAFACACSGIKFTAIFSDAFSESKRLTMEALGAEVVVIPSYGKGISSALIKEMRSVAYDKVEQLSGFYADQFGSKNVVLGYQAMGFEIAKQIEGKVDLLCGSVGTGGALMGTLDGLNNKNQYPNVVAFEPSQSPFLTTGLGGSHKVEGVGVGFYPPFLESSRVNQFMTVDQCEAFEMRKTLAKKYGIFCGT
jgi:cysteine synthase A